MSSMTQRSLKGEGRRRALKVVLGTSLYHSEEINTTVPGLRVLLRCYMLLLCIYYGLFSAIFPCFYTDLWAERVGDPHRGASPVQRQHSPLAARPQSFSRQSSSQVRAAGLWGPPHRCPLGISIKTKHFSSSLNSLLFLRWVRGEHFRYKFSQPGSSSAAQGKWWLRKRIGAYFPPVNLEGLRGYFQSRNWPHPLTHPNRTWEEISVALQPWRKGHAGQNFQLHHDKLLWNSSGMVTTMVIL